MEGVEEGCAGEDKKTPHDQSTQNPPEENPVVIDFGDSEVGEDDQKYKDVINT